MTPIRAALKAKSCLQTHVQDGLRAVIRGHRDCFGKDVRSAFADSLDADKALQQGREQENRWDYLLGHTKSGQIIGVEPHSANSSEVSTVISKREAARRQLREHLRDGVHVTKWLWVASGNVRFLPFEPIIQRLSQNGIEFVGTRVGVKHLPP